ncbi:hypothetical protein AnigIFM60653_009358 [Aspergillus niger]|nr:hypothetical protein AnigIFM60653_009358 [Aspergillus niger]
MSSVLPPEGLTLETIFVPFYHTVLQPIFTGPILYGLLRYPAQVNEWSGKLQLGGPSTLKAIGIAFSLGLLVRLNDWLSRKALNSFTNDGSWNWNDEIIVITGGSSGIGAMVARKLSKTDSTVIILDINRPSASMRMCAPCTLHINKEEKDRGVDAKLIVELIIRLAENIQYYELDITSSLDVQRVADQIRQQHGDPTILINNAGIGLAKLILDEDIGLTRKTFDVNIIAHFDLVKQFLPAMIKSNHGHVVTVASMASFVTQAQNVGYACTKAAALAFHEGLAQELKHRYNAAKVRTR